MWDYIGPMTELHVRNLPPEVHLWLRQRAAAQGRSMSAETVAILRAALQGAQSAAGRSEAIDRLRTIRQRARLGADAPLAEELVRDDRERSG
jgi:plasmid stability protein